MVAGLSGGSEVMVIQVEVEHSLPLVMDVVVRTHIHTLPRGSVEKELSLC